MKYKYVKSMPTQPTNPPNGGWGWLIVVAVFVIGYFTWGVYIAYPVFYQPLMNEFDTTLGKVTWINGAHEAGRAFGHLSMPLLSRNNQFRLPSIILSLVSAIAISLAALVNMEWLLYVFLGFLPGFVLGNLTVSCYVMIARYFDKKMYLAFGLSQCGNAIGTLSLAPLFQFLSQNYGIRGALLLTGAISLHLVIASALFRPISLLRDEASASPKSFTADIVTAKKLLAMPKFWIAVSILLCVYGGLRTYVAFLVPLANTFSDADEVKSSFLLSILCGISLVSRVLIGVAGDLQSVDVALLLLIFALFSSIGFFSVWFVSSYIWLAINCGIVSIVTSTCHIMVVPIITAAVGESNLQLGVSLTGFIYILLGAGIVPFTGYLIDQFESIRLSYLIAGLLMFIGSLLHIPLLRRRQNCQPEEKI